MAIKRLCLAAISALLLSSCVQQTTPNKPVVNNPSFHKMISSLNILKLPCTVYGGVKADDLNGEYTFLGDYRECGEDWSFVFHSQSENVLGLLPDTTNYYGIVALSYGVDDVNVYLITFTKDGSLIDNKKITSHSDVVYVEDVVEDINYITIDSDLNIFSMFYLSMYYYETVDEDEYSKYHNMVDSMMIAHIKTKDSNLLDSLKRMLPNSTIDSEVQHYENKGRITDNGTIEFDESTEVSFEFP